MDWITPSIISGAIITGSALISLAIAEHTTTLHQLAERCEVARPVTEHNWCSSVEQLIADITSEQVAINAFSQMSAGRRASMRFVANDSRVYVFAICRRLPDCHGHGRDVTASADLRANAELHALWQHLMASTDQAGPLPRHARWYLLPPQAPQNKTDTRLKVQQSIARCDRRWPSLRHHFTRQ